jgi:hypothetical protein
MCLGFHHIDKHDFLKAYPEARDNVFTIQNTQRGFRATGSQLLSSATLIDPMTLFGSNPLLEQLFNSSGMGFSPETEWGYGWGWEWTGLNSSQDMF